MSLNQFLETNPSVHKKMKTSHSTTSIDKSNTLPITRNTRSFNRSPSYIYTHTTQPSVPNILTITNSIDTSCYFPSKTNLETVSKEIEVFDRKRKLNQRLSLSNSISSNNISYHSKKPYMNTTSNDYIPLVLGFGKGKERSIKKELDYLKHSLLTTPNSQQKNLYNPPIAFTSFNTNNNNRFNNNINTSIYKKNDTLEYIKHYSPCQRKIIRKSNGLINNRGLNKDNGNNNNNSFIKVVRPLSQGKIFFKKLNDKKQNDFIKERKDKEKDSVETFFKELNKRNKTLKEIFGLSDKKN